MNYTIMKYLRLSSEDIGGRESDSIANQRALLDDYISKTPDFDGCEVLEAIDDGCSGTNFNRPGVRALLDAARRGEIHCVIVKDLSRFGRNYLEAGDYIEQIFPALGVRFIAVTDMYDSAGKAAGGIATAFRNLVAELYSQELSEKVRSAKAALNKTGKTSAAFGFYGYVKDPNDRHKLIIDEPAAKAVRLIFDLYERGMTTAEIAKKLNKDGVQTAGERKRKQSAGHWLGNRTGKWDSGVVSRILRDERYTGKHIYGKTRRAEVGSPEMKAAPAYDWIVVPGAYPAIISEERFMRVREIRNLKRRRK